MCNHGHKIPKNWKMRGSHPAHAEAIRLGAIGFDAVKLIALARIERLSARLDLAAYPHLPKMAVKTTAAADYAVLLPGMAA